MEKGSPSRRSWADEADEELPSPRSLGAGSPGRGSGGRVLFSDTEDYSHSKLPSPLPPGRGKAVAEPATDVASVVDAAVSSTAAEPLWAVVLLELVRPMEGLLEEMDLTPPFMIKTYDLVDDPNTDTIVSWGSAGKSFVVHDVHAFADEILLTYFEHSDVSSFVMKLYSYGFRKVDPDRLEFANEGFQRGHRELLKTIKRRRPLCSRSSSQQEQADPSLVVTAPQFGGLDRELCRLQRVKRILFAEELAKLQQERQAHLNPVPALTPAVQERQVYGFSELPIAYQSHSTVSRDCFCRSSSTRRTTKSLYEALYETLCAAQQQPSAPISAERCNFWESARSDGPDLVNFFFMESRGDEAPNIENFWESVGRYYYGRRPEIAFLHGVLNQHGYTNHTTRDVNTIGTTADAGTSTGGHNLGNLLASDGGGGSGHLESHGSSRISRWGRPILNMVMTIAGYGTTATGGGEADLEAGGQQADCGATPARQPLVNEKEEAKTLRHFFIQTYATLLPASAMAYPVLKDAPKHVKIIIFGGLVVIITIVLFAGIMSRSLAHRRLAFWLVSCSAVALLTFSVAS